MRHWLRALLIALAAGCLGVTGAWAIRRASTGSEAAAAPVRVLARYPTACLARVPRPVGSGLVAALHDRMVTIASPDGSNPVGLPDRIPAGESFGPGVQWSADGRWLGTGDGRLWTAAGRAAGRLFANGPGSWTWSPAGDCAIGTARRATLSVGVPGRRPRALLRGAIESFAFTPDGRALILVVFAGPGVRPGLFELDLVRNRLRELVRLPAVDCCVRLGGWSPTGNVLLFWAAPGDSVMADGWPLSGLDLAHGRRLVGYGTRRPLPPAAGRLPAAVILPAPDSLATCGRRLLGVIGVGRPRPTIADKRLAYLAPGTRPRPLTPKTLAYLSPTCSPDGSQIAAVQFRNNERDNGPARVALLSASGSFVRYLTPAGQLTDADPAWAAPGILLGRARAGAETFSVQLWFAPAGGAAADTGLRASEWDWSATSPSGLGY